MFPVGSDVCPSGGVFTGFPRFPPFCKHTQAVCILHRVEGQLSMFPFFFLLHWFRIGVPFVEAQYQNALPV